MPIKDLRDEVKLVGCVSMLGVKEFDTVGGIVRVSPFLLEQSNLN